MDQTLSRLHFACVLSCLFEKDTFGLFAYLEGFGFTRYIFKQTMQYRKEINKPVHA